MAVPPPLFSGKAYAAVAASPGAAPRAVTGKGSRARQGSAGRAAARDPGASHRCGETGRAGARPARSRATFSFVRADSGAAELSGTAGLGRPPAAAGADPRGRRSFFPRGKGQLGLVLPGRVGRAARYACGEARQLRGCPGASAPPCGVGSLDGPLARLASLGRRVGCP